MTKNSIVFDTGLDNRQLEKDYAKAVKKVEKLESELNEKTEKKTTLSEQLEEIGTQADAARNRVKNLKSELANIESATALKTAHLNPEGHIDALLRKPVAEAELKEAERALAPLEKEANKLAAQYRAAEEAVDNAAKKLEEQKNITAKISANIEEATAAQNGFDAATGSAVTGIEKLTARITKLATRALVFSTITAGFRLMKDWLGEVVMKNDQTSASIARLKGALLTLAQPLLNVVIPVFTAIVNLLTAVIGKIAAFLSMLGGKTVEESAAAAEALESQANAYDDVANSAKEARKQIMGFDEINKLEDTSTSTSAGGTTSNEIAPDFSWTEGITETMEKLAKWVLAIAAGFALWKIGSALPGTLGLITTAIGKVISGVSLIVAGCILLKEAFQSVSENGMTLENTLLTIAGIIATGLGITLLTGSLIPLLVAGIMGIVVAIASMTGQGEELIGGLRQAFGGFADFLIGSFTGDFDRMSNGAANILLGLYNTIAAILNSLILGAVKLLNSFKINIPGVWEWSGFNIQNPPQIPYLAQGAVIPPNREFMAVLGDQTHGNNIEAPEDLIRKIVREETAGLGSTDRMERLLEELIATVEGIEVGDETIGKAAARYTRRTASARGT